ncbi:MAG: exodeoxyribonuclease III [Acidimicrobiales bacterium]|nr:exodeoxyribonuclease III [Hyphomonadaceae bacterium]RZV36226.1 MAG: exodeoxyribonuclease III [Acidimicrobiales bacterium]
MDIASWNVNSIKARTHAVTQWLDEAKPDIACLQEIKTVDEGFPSEFFEERGYNVATHGQKSYNGVALLSKYPFEEINVGLPGDDEDEQARYLEAVISTDTGPVRFASIYLPNGNPAPGPKYDYKLAWMERLYAHAKVLLVHEEPLILAGDYNVIQSADDTYDAALWADDALFLPQTRAAFQKLKWLGLTEAYEQVDGRPHQYTFWDYQGGAWPKNHGIRIDHLLLSGQAADKLKSVRIDAHVRDREKPSDHVPIIGTFDL